jgi:hypothetical protein
MIRLLVMLLLLTANITEVAAQTRRRASNTTVTTVDSLTRMVIVVNESRRTRDTILNVKDTGVYVPLLPPESREVLPFRDEQGAVMYHNLPYNNPVLSLQMKMVNSVVRDISELKIFVTFSNKTSRSQKFLFDRPSAPGFALWGASCRIISEQHGNVLAQDGKPRYHVHAADSATMRRHQYVLKSSEWMMKQFSVADMVVLNEKICRNGKLPPGNYTLQLIFQGNRSNVVKFTVRK